METYGEIDEKPLKNDPFLDKVGGGGRVSQYLRISKQFVKLLETHGEIDENRWQTVKMHKLLLFYFIGLSSNYELYRLQSVLLRVT